MKIMLEIDTRKAERGLALAYPSYYSRREEFTEELICEMIAKLNTVYGCVSYKLVKEGDK